MGDAHARREQAAELLLSAYATGAPIEPLTATWPGLTVPDAYAIQLAQVRHWTAAGDEVKGHKVGLTAAAMRRQLGVFEPDYGHLMGSMFELEGLPIAASRFLAPRIEPEIAFVLARPLSGPGVTAAQAAAAVEFVLPALEIIDSRIADWRITLADTIADNASSGAVVLGGRPTPLHAVNLRLAGCTLHSGGALVATGAGGAALGSPLNALVWLANTLGELGVTLHPGQVVLSGSVTAAQPVPASGVVTATFGGLGSVTAAFERDQEPGDQRSGGGQTADVERGGSDG
ncbi:2-keto-4-pentenoate hydratase [Parafrankia sp. EUN1f]|uniref:2-keto-4-pentenoate hydratase n=1 Tax=Parafrankia sp. EUN1f TaxID=102897 RepID=UPI0001C4636A|nr:2-oxopent-4-enoate hydratase [Parafrankia sp. EUN1f]